jgi:hypothetical protein
MFPFIASTFSTFFFGTRRTYSAGLCFCAVTTTTPPLL